MDKKQRIIMLDTETTNTLDDPIVYDLGYEIFDLEGNLYDRNSFVNADVFLDKELMASAFFADKVPQYWEEIKQGKRELRTWRTITDTLYKAIKENDATIICAHNSRFDYRAIHTTQRYETSSRWRWVLPWGMEWWDTLKMARATLGKSADYKAFCVAHELLTEKATPRLTAEAIYKYLTRNADFVEAHTGLEDVQIERKIFEHLLRENPEIDGRLWAVEV